MAVSLKPKTPAELVFRCLQECKNFANDEKSRVPAARSLLENISKKTSYLENESIKLNLMEIVLQSCDNGIDDFEDFFIKSCAFRCLKILANELANDFYEIYYNRCKERINEQWSSTANTIAKLDNWINNAATEKSEKFYFLQTLSMCLAEKNCLVEISIFDDFPSCKWCKELLIYYLLSINITWDVAQTPKLLRQINKLDDFIEKNCSYRRIEAVLEIFITNQEILQLDIEFIIHAIKMLSINVENLEILSRKDCLLPEIIEELEISGLREKCDQLNFSYDDKDQIIELHQLLFYSDDIIDALLENIASNNTRLSEIIDFFTLLRDCNLSLEEKIRFIVELDETKQRIDELTKKLFRKLIDAVILIEFTNYKSFEPVASEADDKTYFSSIKKNNNNTSYNETIDPKKSELHGNLEDSIVKTRINGLLSSFAIKMAKLASNCRWTSEKLGIVERLVKSFDTQDKIIQLVDSLDIIIEYEFDITEIKLSNVITTSVSCNIRDNVNDFVIRETFPKAHEKSLEDLIDELAKLNSDGEISLLKEKNALLEAHGDVMRAYNEKSSLLPELPAIKHWHEKHISEWINETRKHKIQDAVDDMTCEDARRALDAMIGVKHTKVLTPSWKNNDDEATLMHNERIALIKRTAELTSGIVLRDIQLLAVIIILSSRNDKGRLAQINTGEGKTIVIAMIAAYHAMSNHRVDIITSSPLLAIPQAKQQKSFFVRLGITVGHNIGQSASYESDVLYGTAHEFQADILRDEFRGCGTRRGRKFDIAIVDEVDNMLIDGNNNIVLLSSEMPAMSHLETLLGTIYTQVNVTANSITERDGKAYFLEQENSFDEAGQMMPEISIKEYPIEGTKREFIIESTELHVRTLIRDCDVAKLSKNLPEIKVPRHLRELICKVQLKKWIERAICAKFSYIKDQDYILENGKIKIVDAKDTGVVKENSHWSHGLHQFLEIKHGAKINPESLTSNYISNVTFFRRYGRRIYGLTGTLGTNGTRELLARTYEVDTLIVPPFRTKRYKELSPIVSRSKIDWYNEIARSCIRKLKNGRAVLIIMEYIKQTEDLDKVFKERFNYNGDQIKLYKTDANSRVVEAAMKSGDVVITTNIAGRGTDIKLSKGVDEKGGLHVCVTFVPKNSRVEQQNTGRTARTGNRGTSQFVLWSQSGISELRKNRAITEEATMRRADLDIRRVTTKDLIFEKFSALVRLMMDKERNCITKETERIAVEERFAIWKEENDEAMANIEQALNNFEAFQETVLRDDAGGKLINNAYMHVQIGNVYLDQENYEKAIDEYTLAINMDPDFAENALYNRGYARIAKNTNYLDENECHIQGAIDDLRKARKLIGEREASLHLLQTASDGQVFSAHVTHKLNLYNVQRNAIDLAIGPDQEQVEQYIKQLEDTGKSGELKTDEDRKKHEEALKSWKKQREEIGVIAKARSKKRDLVIERLMLKDCLPADDLKSHDEEIKEFERNGYMGSFKISERPPIDWCAVAGLLAIGFGQLVIGAALTVFTLGGGASFGMGLISEGISDIITAVKDGIINRTFSWATWLIEKVISIVVSVACAGFSAMKDVANTACAGVKRLGNKVLTTTIKDGWVIVAKKVGLELSKGVGKQVVTELIDYGIDRTLIPTIEEAIVNSIEVPIQEELLKNPLVKIMLELDQKNNNRFLEDRIIALGYKLLSPEKGSTAWHMATSIASRIATNKSSLCSKISQTYSVGKALYDLGTFTSSFINGLNDSIRREAKLHNIDEHTKVEKTTTDIKEEKDDDALEDDRTFIEQNESKPMDDDIDLNLMAEADIKEEKDDDALEDDRTLIEQNESKPMDDDIDLNLMAEADEQVKLDKQPRTPQGISNEFVNAASTNMMGIIKGKLIAPAVQAGVSYSMDKITSGIDASFNDAVENYRATKRIIHHQNEGFPKDPDKDNRTNDQLENHEIVAMNKVDDLIEDTRSGGPAGLVHLGAISDDIDRPINVYDEQGRLKYVIGENKEGEPVSVQYHKPEAGDTIGHYTLPNSQEPVNKSGDKNMCLFNVIAQQTGRSPNELKDSSLSVMESNKHTFAVQAEDIHRLERYSSMNLAMGGVKYDGKNTKDAEIYIKESKMGFMYRDEAHADQHVSIEGDTEEYFKALSKASNKKIEIQTEDGQTRIIDETNGTSTEEPVQIYHHRGGKDKNDEYITRLNDKENKIPLNNPHDNEGLFKMFKEDNNKQSSDPKSVDAKSVDAKLGNLKLDDSKSGEPVSIDPKQDEPASDVLKPGDIKSITRSYLMSNRATKPKCVENMAINAGGPKTGFVTEAGLYSVAHHFLTSKHGQALMDELNKYPAEKAKGARPKRGDPCVKQRMTIPLSDFMPPGKKIYAGDWDANGNLNGEVFEAKVITIVLYHPKGGENNKDSKVHIQTCFPLRPNYGGQPSSAPAPAPPKK